MLTIVRRSFRNFNQMMVPGSVVEPGSIKRFKQRLRDRDLIQIDEHEVDKWNEYFTKKYGTGIIMPANPADDQKPEDQNPEDQKPDDQKPEDQKPAVTAKVVVKAN